MHVRLYWTIQHMKRRMQEMRFAMSCWWLLQQVHIAVWRRCLEVRMPRQWPTSAPVPVQQGKGEVAALVLRA